MKTILILCMFALVVATGCRTALTTSATPTNLAVQMGAATTNDLAVVADLKLAQQLNTQLNPTPTSPLITAGLNASIILFSAFAGWYARHKSIAPPAPPATQ